MNERLDISIIIISWNVRELLRKCLASINEFKNGISLEILVVDNNSPDGSAEIIKNEFPEINLIANDYNAGFAKAVNQALIQARGGYLLLLNPDTEIKQNTLFKSIEYLKSHPKIGVLGCQILNQDGSIQSSVRRFPTLSSQILVLLKLHNFFPNLKSLRKYFALDFDYNKEQEVDQVMGAFFMIRRECLEKVGLFDEKFWLWFEEVDFCKKAQAKGWQVVYFPRAKVIHTQGKSFGQLTAVKEQMIFNKSLLYYFRKNHSFLEYLVLLPFYPISLGLALIVEILDNLSLNPKK